MKRFAMLFVLMLTLAAFGGSALAQDAAAPAKEKTSEMAKPASKKKASKKSSSKKMASKTKKASHKKGSAKKAPKSESSEAK